MHGSDLQKITDLIERHELGKPAMLGSFDNGPSSSGVGEAGGSGSRPSSASSGAVEAEAPPAKRAKTEPEAGVAVKPFDQRPSRFKSDDLTEVPLPNGLVMLFATENHVLLYNPTLPRHSSSRAAQYFVASRRGTGSRKPATRRRTP